jgi:aryl-alcohol dehydrogenase-like predicted oxidoreductase
MGTDIMRYKKLKTAGVELSVLGLGGHEFLPHGPSRGFNEDFQTAVTPGVILKDFGGEKRKAVVAGALAAGVCFFDATIDSEKEALGRNLKQFGPSREIFIQTRPEGMVYTNNPDDQNNWRMADYRLLRAEAIRIARLLGRDKIDFLNFGFLAPALKNDPMYLDKIARNIRNLKNEGLIRFATADTFSGEEFYLKQIGTGCFDAIFINLNIANDGGIGKVLPAAAARGMGVFAREIFMKGELFKMGEEAGLPDRNRLAQAALKWVLALPEVTVAVVGLDNPEHLVRSLEAAERPELTDEDKRMLDAVCATAAYRAYHQARRKDFGL